MRLDCVWPPVLRELFSFDEVDSCVACVVDYGITAATAPCSIKLCDLGPTCASDDDWARLPGRATSPGFPWVAVWYALPPALAMLDASFLTFNEVCDCEFLRKSI